MNDSERKCYDRGHRAGSKGGHLGAYTDGLRDGAGVAFLRGVIVAVVGMTIISTMIVCGLCRHYRGEIRKILHQVALIDSQHMPAPPEYQGAGAEGVEK